MNDSDYLGIGLAITVATVVFNLLLFLAIPNIVIMLVKSKATEAK